MRPNRQAHRPNPGGGDDMATGEVASEMAVVSNGPYGESYPVAGLTVGEIRLLLRDQLDLAPDSPAFINARPVSDDTRLESGQSLLFSRHSGSKGAVAA
jgi:hypothetical protein